MPEKKAAQDAQTIATLTTEVAVVGAGLSGLTLAAALGGAGVETVLVERSPLDRLDGTRHDSRTTAIAFGSKRALDAIGVWARLAPDAQPILEIRVSDGRPGGFTSSLFLHYDHAEVGTDPLGHIAENHLIRRALMQRIRQCPSVRVLAPAVVERLDNRADGADLALDDGRIVRCQLVAAADGSASPLRTMAGIKVSGHRYGQTALICNVAHERPHGAIAHERFLPGGPFAILPMTDDPRAAFPHRSSVVWSEAAEAAAGFAALDDAAFLEALRLRFTDFMGDLALASPRGAYPLALHMAHSYGTGRVVLVGEAAHAIHPIAGQGLNMGWRDIAALAEEIVDARRLGLDVGRPQLLAAYQARRRADNLVLATVTDALNRLFSNDIGPVRAARDLGLAAVNRLPPVKRVLMRHAMGVLGGQSRLVRGKRL
ncbi:MAG: UbiH/UbiF/VisC/COQ6 family ubiquinone biosynthesis hydroxylase [Alphaproteobacteria bacterium]